MIKNKFPWMIKGMAFVAAFIFVGTWVAMLLWNNLVVSLFHAPVLNFWQMLGLMLLGRLMCGGFGRRHGHWGKQGYSMRQKWYSMTDEEKAEYKAKWKNKTEE